MLKSDIPQGKFGPRPNKEKMNPSGWEFEKRRSLSTEIGQNLPVAFQWSGYGWILQSDLPGIVKKAGKQWIDFLPSTIREHETENDSTCDAKQSAMRARPCHVRLGVGK